MTVRKSPVDYVVEDRGHDTPCWAWQLSKGSVNPAHLQPLTTATHLRQHSQLTPEMVAEIRSRYVPRKVTRAMLADEFGTSTRNIKHIIAGSTWQEVQTA